MGYPIQRPEPHRTIQIGGPFRVQGTIEASGRAELIVEATRRVRVDRFVVLYFRAGELTQVVEHRGYSFRRGERRSFMLRPEGVLRLEISGLLTVSSYEFEATPEI